MAVSQGWPGTASLALSQTLTLHAQTPCCEEAWATHKGHMEVSEPRSQVWEVTHTTRHRGKKPFEMTLTQMTLGFSLKDKLSKPPS